MSAPGRPKRSAPEREARTVVQCAPFRTPGPAVAEPWVGGGTLVLTPRRRICSADEAADRILDAGDALVAIEDRLAAVRPADDRRLESAIDRVLRRTPSPGDSTCIAQPLARRSGRPDYVLLLCRGEGASDTARWSGGEAEPRIVMVIHAFDARPAMPTELLQESFGLTAAEARLAAQFSRGCGPEQAAEDLGVSLSTVRTHLRAIYRKTGTSGQVDLAWRIGAVATAAAIAAAAAAALERAAIAASSKWTSRGNSQEAGRRTEPSSRSCAVSQ